MRVAALFIYPIKSCAATALDEALLEPLGLQHDRRFAFVDASGKTLTQRELPLLATVRPSLAGESLHLDLGGLRQVSIPLQPNRATASMPEASDYLGAEVRLARLEPTAAHSFADLEPVLLASTATLHALGRQTGMDRFRANIVVEGAPARAESAWTQIRSAQVELECTSPCERCEMIGDEALRRVWQQFNGNFGVYGRVVRSGRLRRGERLTAGEVPR